MPRAKKKDSVRAVAAQRIKQYVVEQFTSTRVAAEVLGVDHNTIWRAMNGLNVRGPSMALVLALATLSGKPTDYWLGRAE